MDKIKSRGVLTIATIIGITSLTGCTSILKEDAARLPLVAPISEREVIDYYAKALSYDAVVTRNIDVERSLYETTDITDKEKINKIVGITSRVERELGKMSYTHSEELSDILSESTFNYIKSFLNDKKLTGPTLVSAKEAMGYYFVDIEYDVSNRSIGSFTNRVSLLGINGAFIKEHTGSDRVDNSYLNNSVIKLNNYYRDNRTDRRASYNEGSGLLAITGGSDNSVMNYTTTTITEDVTNESNEGQADEGQADEGQADEGQAENIVDTSQNISVTLNNRKPSIDISEFNRIVGSSTRETAYMPKLSMVYNVPNPEGAIGGIGIYPSGANGLARYQFNRSQIDGKMVLRYVFKEDLVNPSKILGVNVYPVSMEIQNNIGNLNANDASTLVIPEFLQLEFEKLIERSDRAILNNDMTALMSGNIYTDAGMAVLRGYESNYVNVLRQMTTSRRLVTRDIDNNSYVLEFERLRQEGPKGADVYGTFIDTGYFVIEQMGNDFLITDEFIMAREMRTEPDINPDSAIEKRLVALNLAGAISQENKDEIEKLMADLYLASTNRVLHGPQEINGVTIERGMYDCFNSDVYMLSSTRKEYINSTIREHLVKHGVNVPSEFQGTVVSWIGGADRQAEFIAEEVMTYQGRSTGTKMDVYYLVSNMNNEWVIDERTVLNIEEISGEALGNLVSRVNKQ